MINQMGEYVWSSYNYYAYGKANALITENLLYKSLGQSEVARQESYRNYVEATRAYESIVDKYFKERVLI
jgi:hypothetical protein